jgi:hypothetical protein
MLCLYNKWRKVTVQNRKGGSVFVFVLICLCAEVDVFGMKKKPQAGLNITGSQEHVDQVEEASLEASSVIAQLIQRHNWFDGMRLEKTRWKCILNW